MAQHDPLMVKYDVPATNNAQNDAKGVEEDEDSYDEELNKVELKDYK